MGILLNVQNLTKTFSGEGKGDYTAVDYVSFQIRQGETVGLVGESGCGKSTLAKLITRLLEPDAGFVRLDGEDITRLQGKALKGAYRKMQMVFQSPMGSFNPRRTIGFGIGESMQNSGVPKAERMQRIAVLLEQCGLLPEFAGRYPHELSGGQCQRAAIARGLAVNPKLLICDEATSALDVTVQQQIVELLISLKQERNLSLLFICHNLALVQSFCDRLLVMHRGNIVEQGVTDQVIQAPKSEYTKRLIEAAF